MDLTEYQKKLNKAQGQKNYIQKELAKTKRNVLSQTGYLETVEKARAYIQLKAEETQNQISIRIEDIVQMAIDTCFSEQNIEFKLKFESKRNRTEAKLLLVKEGWEMDALDSSGEGFIDLETFGLRIGSWTLEQSDNVIILDEPFKNLDNKRKPLAGEILRELSKRLNLQMIIATHDKGIVDVADRVFNIEHKKGVSKIIVQ